MSSNFFSILIINLTVLYTLLMRRSHSDIVNSVDSLRNIFRLHTEQLTSNKNASITRGNCDIFKYGFHLEDRIVEHPIAAYVLIKCLVQYKKTYFSKDKYLSEVDESDYEAAALSLVRIQETYDLKVEELMDGRLLNYRSNITLTVGDCLMIANQALRHLNIDSASVWLTACRELASSEDESSTEMLNPMTKTLQQLRELTHDKKSLQTRISIAQLFPDVNDDAILMLNEREEILDMKHRLSHNTNLLCQGLRDESHLTGRFCEFQRNPHSWVPHFVERVHEDPKILLFHRILDDKDIEHIKRLASSKFAVSKVHRFNSHEPFSSSRRVGKGAFLPSNSSKTMKRLYRRVEEALGLSTQSAEDLQVHNYGVGGHYEVHMDFVDSNAKKLALPNGDRIATFLIYLNDVEYGGATAFPQLGTAVQPTKGSALTWYNLKQDGMGDYRTLHAACPILVGTKWIATVWLHEHGQELKKPCPLK